MENKIKVTTTSAGYNEARNFINLPFRQSGVKRSYDFFNLLNFAHYKIFKKNDPKYLNLHLDLGTSGAKIQHFFNKISLNKTPWVVTFETALPRWNIDSEFGMNQLAKDPCKKLIAMSECAYKIQENHMEKFPKHKDAIMEKMAVIHPAQKLLINHYQEKQFTDEFIHFTMVGGAFFRKGGGEVLKAFSDILDEGLKVKLHIVSNMEYGDYASRATKEDYDNAKKIIAKYPSSIFHYERLPNNKVLELMKNSHVGLLPTWAETYGYSVLEAQAAGCPVISTDVRALPEVNNDEAGWVINVPKNEFGYALIDTPEDRVIFSSILKREISNIIRDIAANPNQIRRKGEAALQRISRFHNPLDKALQIENIYKNILETQPRSASFGEQMATVGKRVSQTLARGASHAFEVITKNSFLG